MMNVFSAAILAGIKIHYQPNKCSATCGCKNCFIPGLKELLPSDRTLYRELQKHKVQKCTKKACKKFGCECGWEE